MTTPEDPFNGPDDYEDSHNTRSTIPSDPFEEYNSTAESSGSSGTPTWVWLVGIIVGIFALCGLAACGLFFFVGQNIQEVVEGITGTIEASAAGSDIGATLEANDNGIDVDVDVDIEVPTFAPIDIPTLEFPTLEPLGEATPDLLPTLEIAIAPTDVPEEVVVEEEEEAAVSPNPIESESANDAAYIDIFDSAGSWGIGDLTSADGFVEVTASVDNGVLLFESFKGGYYWTTTTVDLGDGIYEIEATAVGGSEDNGMGLIFFANDETDDYHLFEVSSDGFVWIGSCQSGCETLDMLVDDGWFESDAVNTGLEATNRLRVEARDGKMTFYVNDQQVGEASDSSLRRGTIGVAIESFDEETAVIEFDNFTYTPWP